MDKEKQKALKKQLKEQYKHQELLKQAEDKDPILSSFARTQLGIDLPSITQQTINSAANEYELTLRLYHKIVEKAKRYNSNNRSIYSQDIDETVERFSEYLQAIYDTYLFECSLAIGDIDKVFHYESEFEKSELARQTEKLVRAYQLMGCSKMIQLIEKGAQKVNNYNGLQILNEMYEQIKMEVSLYRFKFIKDNWKEFEMN